MVNQIKVNTFEEKLPNGKVYLASYRTDISFTNSDKYLVLKIIYFSLEIIETAQKIADLSEVGYVHKNNLVGKAQILFFHQIHL